MKPFSRSAVLWLLLTACYVSSAKAGTAPCSILSKADVEDILNEPVKKMQLSENQCTYTRTDPPRDPASVFYMTIFITPAKEGDAEALEKIKTLEKVEGLSLPAFWTAGHGELTFFKGTERFSISLRSVEMSGALPIAKKAAQLVMERL